METRPCAYLQTAPGNEERPYSLRHRKRPWVTHQKLVALSFLGDAAVVFAALMIAYLTRFETTVRGVGVSDDVVDFQSYCGHVLFGGLLFVTLLANFRAHDPRNFLAIGNTVMTLVKSSALWLVLFLGITLVLKIDPPISRLYCGIGFIYALGGLLLWRCWLYSVLRRDSYADMLRQKILFLGWSEESGHSWKRMQAGCSHQMKPLGVVLPPDPGLAPPADVPVLGSYGSLRAIIRGSGCDVLMVVDGCLTREQALETAETCGREFIDFKMVPHCFQILISTLQLEQVCGMPVLGVGRMPLHHAFNNLAKRTMDILGSLMGLAVFSPLMAFAAVLVYLESPGPVIYRQRRIGLNGKPFDMFKIRSMKLNAEKAGSPGWTVKDDPRRLKIGVLLREWNIDELPQFWNVLTGDMSLVGPRPERPELIEDFKEEIPHYNVRHNIKPGVTGWAQVNGLRGDTSLRERVKFDLEYIEKWNFAFDLRIMFLTFFKRSGAC